MLTHIAMLEGAAEKRLQDLGRSEQPGDVVRAAALTRTRLMEARMAEQELLRVEGASPVDISIAIDAGMERGRSEAALELVMGVLAGSAPL